MWWLGGLVNTHIGTMCVCACVWWFVYFLYLAWWLGGLVNTHIGTMCVCVRVFGGLHLDGGFVCGGLVGKGKEGGGFALGSFSSFFFCLYS